jgi:hypothetical protein
MVIICHRVLDVHTDFFLPNRWDRLRDQPLSNGLSVKFPAFYHLTAVEVQIWSTMLYVSTVYEWNIFFVTRWYVCKSVRSAFSVSYTCFNPNGLVSLDLSYVLFLHICLPELPSPPCDCVSSNLTLQLRLIWSVQFLPHTGVDGPNLEQVAHNSTVVVMLEWTCFTCQVEVLYLILELFTIIQEARRTLFSLLWLLLLVLETCGDQTR